MEEADRTDTDGAESAEDRQGGKVARLFGWG